MATKIEWTDISINPIVGCTKVSPGCDSCYAERMSNRLINIEHSRVKYSGTIVNGKWSGLTKFIPDELLKIPKSGHKKIFMCSMSDLFHENNPFEIILKIWDAMCENPQHIFQILTKRPERMLEFYKWLGQKCKDDGFDSVPSSSDNLLHYVGTPDHIWLGVTAENQEMANYRIPFLLQVPAKIRFVSCEPLLSDMNLLNIDAEMAGHDGMYFINALTGHNSDMGRPCKPVNKLSWVICGPETGPGKRPMKKEWIESLYSQCKHANVPFFDKKNTLGLNCWQFPD